MVNDSLTKFANTLYAEAIEEKTRIEKQVREEKEAALAKCDAELEEKFRREVEKFRSLMENEKRLTLSRREVELMTELRRIRQAAADEVIANVEKRLCDFVQGDGYADYLSREAAAADMFASGKTVCAARECDRKLLNKLLTIDGLEFETASDDIIGGFILKNTELGLMADCTLRNKLEENKELFLEISGLVID